MIWLAVGTVLILATLVLMTQFYPVRQEPARTVEIEMIAKQWFFQVRLMNSTDPGAQARTVPTTGSLANTTIVVTKGDAVIIHFSTGDIPHGFAIRGYPDVGPFEVTPGQIVAIRFTANQAGTFIFYCTVFCGPGHPNHKGTLIVLE